MRLAITTTLIIGATATTMAACGGSGRPSPPSPSPSVPIASAARCPLTDRIAAEFAPGMHLVPGATASSCGYTNGKGGNAAISLDVTRGYNAPGNTAIDMVGQTFVNARQLGDTITALTQLGAHAFEDAPPDGRAIDIVWAQHNREYLLIAVPADADHAVTVATSVYEHLGRGVASSPPQPASEPPTASGSAPLGDYAPIGQKAVYRDGYSYGRAHWADLLPADAGPESSDGRQVINGLCADTYTRLSTAQPMTNDRTDWVHGCADGALAGYHAH